MSVKNTEIAERIKTIRELSDITIEEIAKKIGIPVEEYTGYETGRLDIPVSFLYDFCGEMKISMTELLTGERARLHNFCIVRKNKGLIVDRNEAYGYKNLAYPFADRKIEPLLVTVGQSTRNKPFHLNSHNGQEYHYCLSGEYQLSISGKEFTIYQGDSVYFDSNEPHGMKISGERDAEILVIVI